VRGANAAANPPEPVVTYNFRPKTGTKQEAGPPFFSYSGAYMVNTLTPTLRDTFVDADGDKVHAREIAADLFLSVGTVRNRLSSAVGKLHARTLVDAVRIAERHGWI
jgi:hypothetical protein